MMTGTITSFREIFLWILLVGSAEGFCNFGLTPANLDCPAATEIRCGQALRGTTCGIVSSAAVPSLSGCGITDPPTPVQALAVWYRALVPAGVTVEASTCFWNNSIANDVVSNIAMFRSTATPPVCDALTCVDVDFGGNPGTAVCPRGAQVSAPFTVPTTVFFLVGGLDTAPTGDFIFSLACSVASNLQCDQPLPLACNQNWVDSTIGTAVATPAPPTCAPEEFNTVTPTPTATKYYSLRVAHGTGVTVSTCYGSSFATGLAVLEGTVTPGACDGVTTCAGYDVGSCGNINSTTSLPVGSLVDIPMEQQEISVDTVSFDNYLIKVHGAVAGETGSFWLRVTCVEPELIFPSYIPGVTTCAELLEWTDEQRLWGLIYNLTEDRIQVDTGYSLITWSKYDPLIDVPITAAGSGNLVAIKSSEGNPAVVITECYYSHTAAMQAIMPSCRGTPFQVCRVVRVAPDGSLVTGFPMTFTVTRAPSDPYRVSSTSSMCHNGSITYTTPNLADTTVGAIGPCGYVAWYANNNTATGDVENEWIYLCFLLLLLPLLLCLAGLLWWLCRPAPIPEPVWVPKYEMAMVAYPAPVTQVIEPITPLAGFPSYLPMGMNGGYLGA